MLSPAKSTCAFRSLLPQKKGGYPPLHGSLDEMRKLFRDVHARWKERNLDSAGASPLWDGR